jgi:hypothetical protein
MVSEDLRHLNTHVILSMLRSRVDFSPKAPWIIRLSEIFAAIKWDSPLPWEPGGASNVASGANKEKNASPAAATGNASEPVACRHSYEYMASLVGANLGPTSLRKTSNMKDPSSASAGNATHNTSSNSPGKQASSMSRALAPSAEEMASSAVIGSTASRYAAVKSKRSGYFIDSSLGQTTSGATHRPGNSMNASADAASGAKRGKHGSGGSAGGSGGGSAHLSHMLEAVSAQQQSQNYRQLEEKDSMHNTDVPDRHGGSGSPHTRAARRNSPMMVQSCIQHYNTHIGPRIDIINTYKSPHLIVSCCFI